MHSFCRTSQGMPVLKQNDTVDSLKGGHTQVILRTESDRFHFSTYRIDDKYYRLKPHVFKTTKWSRFVMKVALSHKYAID